MTKASFPLTRPKRSQTSVCIFSHTPNFHTVLTALQEAGYRVAGHLTSVSTAHNSAVMPESFDMIITELTLLYTRGITTLKILHTLYPNIPILVYHTDRSSRTIASTYHWGGRGYVIKSTEDSPPNHSELIHATDVVSTGGVYTPSEYAEEIVAYLVDRRTHNELQRLLSETEYKIVAYLYQSWPIEKIAEHLDLTLRSTRTTISRIKKKLEISDARLWQLFINSDYPDCVDDLKKLLW